ncbi:MAG: glycine--tRNA ligase subunit beta [Proteobacteria bacterium]|nr:glycine--tRNA ligase subunit beta [Pseudomonadota bacterium]
MSTHANLLIEIGTEELPPKALLKLSTEFQQEIEKRLTASGLHFTAAESYATPRRLAVKILGLTTSQMDQEVIRRGPALSAAFDSAGNPTQAALGFASSCGIDVAGLSQTKTEKDEWLSFAAKIEGQATSALVPDIISQSLAALPIPKRMRWGSSEVEFVRPVHWVVALLGTEKIDATILGVASGTTTRGHRFHTQEPLLLQSADDYPAILEAKGYVLAKFTTRREVIAARCQKLAEEVGGLVIIDPKLLDEVTALVEWPVPLCGSFEPHFLELPREVLIASMQDHQKYFPVESNDGKLTNKFITVCNIDSTDPNAVRSGNEKVIRPRLSDAAFFWDQDRKSRLDERIERLNSVVFEKRLGSVGEKSNRVAHLARNLAKVFSADPGHAARAAALSRCDLLTDMVGEFPELQGTMGRYYAAHDGDATEVSQALGEFYMPRFAGDSIPTSAAGCCVAFADKLDTLVGIFAIGGAPTGDKDPFALRRAALGCIRIAIESRVQVSLGDCLAQACEGIANVIDSDDVAAPVKKFMLDRLRGYFIEKDMDTSIIEAVLAVNSDNPFDIQQRIEAVAAFRQLPESDALASANKRIANILRKNNIDQTGVINRSLLQDSAERILADRILDISDIAQALLAKQDYASYLTTLSQLNGPIDKFFSEVMVMCDDATLRDNRIAILTRIRELFTQVADIARLNV